MRTWLTTLAFLLALTELSAFAQHVYPTSANKDPELFTITLERERLKQDEQNFMLTQMTQSELESQAQKLRRQLQMLSMGSRRCRHPATTGMSP